MTPFKAILLALQASVWLTVFSLGLRTRLADLGAQSRRPWLLARALVAIFALPPAFAMALVLALPIPATVRFALLALSVSPAAPALGRRQPKIGAEAHAVAGLLVLAAAVSVVATPVLVALAAGLLGAHAAVHPGVVARTVLVTIAAPLAVGVALRLAAARAAAVAGRLADRIGGALFLAAALALLVVAGPGLAPLMRDGVLLVITATVLVAMAAGHLLGRGREAISAPLALAAATRHPGVAMAIAAASFPGQTRSLAAAVLLVILVNAVVSAPYAWWMGRRSAGTRRGAPAAAGA